MPISVVKKREGGRRADEIIARPFVTRLARNQFGLQPHEEFEIENYNEHNIYMYHMLNSTPYKCLLTYTHRTHIKLAGIAHKGLTMLNAAC